MIKIRNNWTIDEINNIYSQPLLDLVFHSATVHRKFHDPREIQISSLLSIKTGGCTEDCKYCSQSSFYETATTAEPMMKIDEILKKAKQAKENGSSRFCLSTAWRQIPNVEMENILEIIRNVNQLDLEVCATMGMLSQTQAKQLKDAGLHTYNHNLDTGENYYDKIISTRSYQDRLDTLNVVQEAGLNICSGGILGMGESKEDRFNMLKNLSSLKKHPESVPINVLVPIEGTEMKKDPDFSFWDLLRTVATARIIMPQSNVRLSAGRASLNDMEQSFCFFAGANSIFSGEKLLTTNNALPDQDEKLFQILGLYKK
ncbi:MAG: biotin synthase BioB [Spirochaetia bacterium]|nr:biotin synthase BioB [Spirochaetia bacterium]